MYIAKAFARPGELDRAVREATQALGPEVVRLRYSLERDWSGDEAIIFRVVLSDEASRRENLLPATTRIEWAILDRLQPLEEWGVLPYFRYRSQTEQTEQADLQEPAWA